MSPARIETDINDVRLLPFAAGDIPGFAVTHHTRTHWSVRVWGNLGPFWADAFALGLSGVQIGILRGFGRQDGAGRWIADFVLAPGPDAPEPSSLDFLALAFGAPSPEDGLTDGPAGWPAPTSSRA